MIPFIQLLLYTKCFEGSYIIIPNEKSRPRRTDDPRNPLDASFQSSVLGRPNPDEGTVSRPYVREFSDIQHLRKQVLYII